MADEPRDALRRLEQRLTSASDAAERLIAEAARTAERGKPPPAGWQTRPEDERRGGELEALIQAVQSIRELLPPDVLERLATALKELLLAIRALIDWYLERIDRKRAEPSTDVEDIPIA
jgi:sugar-specific transcriptional regulator TrmB